MHLHGLFDAEAMARNVSRLTIARAHFTRQIEETDEMLALLAASAISHPRLGRTAAIPCRHRSTRRLVKIDPRLCLRQ